MSKDYTLKINLDIDDSKVLAGINDIAENINKGLKKNASTIEIDPSIDANQLNKLLDLITKEKPELLLNLNTKLVEGQLGKTIKDLESIFKTYQKKPDFGLDFGRLLFGDFNDVKSNKEQIRKNLSDTIKDVELMGERLERLTDGNLVKLVNKLDQKIAIKGLELDAEKKPEESITEYFERIEQTAEAWIRRLQAKRWNVDLFRGDTRYNSFIYKLDSESFDIEHFLNIAADTLKKNQTELLDGLKKENDEIKAKNIKVIGDFLSQSILPDQLFLTSDIRKTRQMIIDQLKKLVLEEKDFNDIDAIGEKISKLVKAEDLESYTEQQANEIRVLFERYKQLGGSLSDLKSEVLETISAIEVKFADDFIPQDEITKRIEWFKKNIEILNGYIVKINNKATNANVGGGGSGFGTGNGNGSGSGSSNDGKQTVTVDVKPQFNPIDFVDEVQEKINFGGYTVDVKIEPVDKFGGELKDFDNEFNREVQRVYINPLQAAVLPYLSESFETTELSNDISGKDGVPVKIHPEFDKSEFLRQVEEKLYKIDYDEIDIQLALSKNAVPVPIKPVDIYKNDLRDKGNAFTNDIERAIDFVDNNVFTEQFIKNIDTFSLAIARLKRAVPKNDPDSFITNVKNVVSAMKEMDNELSNVDFKFKIEEFDISKLTKRLPKEETIANIKSLATALGLMKVALNNFNLANFEGMGELVSSFKLTKDHGKNIEDFANKIKKFVDTLNSVPMLADDVFLNLNKAIDSMDRIGNSIMLSDVSIDANLKVENVTNLIKAINEVLDKANITFGGGILLGNPEKSAETISNSLDGHDVKIDVDATNESINDLPIDVTEELKKANKQAEIDVVGSVSDPVEFAANVTSDIKTANVTAKIDVVGTVETPSEFAANATEELKKANEQSKIDVTGTVRNPSEFAQNVTSDLDEANVTAKIDVEGIVKDKNKFISDIETDISGTSIGVNITGKIDDKEQFKVDIENKLSNIKVEIDGIKGIITEIKSVDTTAINITDEFLKKLNGLGECARKLKEAFSGGINVGQKTVEFIKHIETVSESLKKIKNGISFDSSKLDLSGVVDIAKHSDNIKNFADAIERLREAMSGFDQETFKNMTLSLKELKMSKNAGEFIEEFADKIPKLTNALKQFDSSAQNSARSIKEMADSLSQLSGKSISKLLSGSSKSINLRGLNSYKFEFEKILSESNKSKQTKSDNIKKVKTELSALETSIESYYNLLIKVRTGNASAFDYQLIEQTSRRLKDLVGKAGELKENVLDDNVKSMIDSIVSSYGKVDDIEEIIDGIGSKFNIDLKDLSGYGEFSEKLQECIDKIKNFKNVNEINADEIKEQGKTYKELIRLIRLANSEQQKSNKSNIKVASESAVNVFLAEMNKWRRVTNPRAGRYFSEILDEIEASAKKAGITVDELNEAISKFHSVQNAAVNSGKQGYSVIDKISSKFNELMGYISTYEVFYGVVNLLKQVYEIVKEYNTQLTEMRKVYNGSLTTLKEYQNQTFGVANAIGTTASTLQSSTADWLRIGESLKEAAKSAQESIKLFNISEFESIDEATNSLLAMSQAYQEIEKEAIVDKLNYAGNNFPIATNELASSLQKSAATLKVAGNTIDEAIALTVAGNAILQDADSVGAGLKTVSLRITGTEAARAELEELGEETENVVHTTSKLQETIKECTAVASNEFKGFDILNENGNYKSTYEILSGIAEVYQEIVDADRVAGTNRTSLLVETLAGKNRANIVSSILQSPVLLKEAMDEVANNYDGSAQEELEKHLDSINGKLEQLTNSVHELFVNFINEETIKGTIDILTDLLNVIEPLTTAMGEVGALGSIAGAALTKFGLGKQNLYNASFYKVA